MLEKSVRTFDDREVLEHFEACSLMPTVSIAQNFHINCFRVTQFM